MCLSAIGNGIGWPSMFIPQPTTLQQVRNLTKPLIKRAGKCQMPLVLQLPTDAASEMADSFVKAREWLLEQLKGLKVHVHTCMHVPTHVHVHTCACTCTHTHTHTHTHILTLTHTSTTWVTWGQGYPQHVFAWCNTVKWLSRAHCKHEGEIFALQSVCPLCTWRDEVSHLRKHVCKQACESERSSYDCERVGGANWKFMLIRSLFLSPLPHDWFTGIDRWSCL